MDDRTPGGATIADVAAAASTSIRTVSRVLNNSPKVNAATRERVQKVIGALNFRPSARARALALGRSFLLGVAQNDRNALVMDAVQRGIVAEATERGYELVVHPTPIDPDLAIPDLIQFLGRSKVDGLLVLPPVSGVPGLPEALAAEGIPAIALSAVPIAGYANVIISAEREAAAGVARYLVGLGHRRIAMVHGPRDTISAQERKTGFREALAASGMALLAEAEGDYGFQSGVKAAERLLDHEPRPTAIFAANDIMAAGVLKVAAARGIAVPGDLSVIGFDGSLIAEMLTPALTTVSRPFGAMAQIATRLLIDLVDGKESHPFTLPPLTLVEAESAGPPPEAPAQARPASS